MTRMQTADLMSGVGALVLGLGLGALWERWLTPGASVIAVAGLVTHGAGMWSKHRREASP